MTDETRSLHSSGDSLRQAELDDVLADYLRRQERGEAIDRDALLAKHPELAGDLQEFFANQERFGKVMQAPPGSSGSAPTRLRYFGDYELLDEIAHGGMGVVYKARQTSLNRLVAVKMILAGQLANEEEVKRFQAEAEAAANLHHPGVVAIYEVGINNGQHYYSMEYVEGRDLAAVLREKPVGVMQAAQYLREIAEIIEFAHSQGVLHRDLKPSNILIDASDRLRITDFGLAKRVQSATDLTVTGQVLGTPNYMSPEQAAAQHAVIGPTTDVYSLGTILYELLTGRPPFRSDNIGETLRQVQQEEPVRPRLLNPKLPRDLETICLKCLEKELRRRYATAQLLADDLGRYLRGEPILARPIRAWQRAVKWVRRRPVIAGLLIALAVSVVVGSASSALFAWREGERAKNESFQRSRAEQGERLAIAAEVEQRRLRVLSEQRERELRWRLYVGRVHAMNSAWQDGQFGQLGRLLQQTMPASGETDLRGWEWYFLNGQYLQEARTVPGAIKSGPVVAWNHSTNLLAVVDQHNQIEIWNPDTLTLLRTLPPLPEPPQRLAWSENGEWIAAGCVATRTVFLIDGQDGAVRHSWPLNGAGRISDLVWRPAHNQVAVATFQGQVSLLDIEQVEPIRTLHKRDPQDFLGAIAWTHDGQRLAIGGRFGWIRLYDPEMDSILWERKHLEGVARAMTWSPDDELLAVAMNHELLLTTPAGKLEKRLGGHPGDINRLAWAGNHRLISAAEDHTVKVWSVPTARLLRTIQVHTGPVMDLAVSPDGLRFASAAEDQSVKLSLLTSPQLAARRDAHIPERIHDIAFNDAGTQLASVGWDKKARIWDVATGASQWVVNHNGHPFLNAVAWSADGAQVAIIDNLGHMVLVDALSGKSIRQWKLGKNGVSCVAWSHDGRTIAIALGVTEPTELWNARTFDRQTNLKNHGAHFLAWNPDDTYLATVNGDGILELWDPTTGEPRSSRNFGSDRHNRVAWRSDGRVIAAAGQAGEVLIYDPKDPTRAIARFQGHRGAAKDVAWIQDGSRLASCGIDGTVRVWDASREELLLTLSNPNETPFECVAWSRNGAVIAAGDVLGRLHYWKLSESAPSAASTPAVSSDSRPPAQVSTRAEATPAAYNHLGGVLRFQAKFDESMAAFEESIRLQPENTAALNNLAWLLTTCPDSRLQDAKRAVALAAKAVHFAPLDASYWNTLGAAHYRDGDWDSAIAALEKSNELDLKAYAYGHNAVFLAMSHWQLDDQEKARSWYDKAVEWASANKELLAKDGRGPEIEHFRVEAAALLGIEAESTAH